MPAWGRWALGVCVALVVIGGPSAYFRSTYTNFKRLRIVTDGKFYRSGQLTAGGFREAWQQYHWRTVINLQEENNDPFMPEVWLGKPCIRESDLCKELGITYYVLNGDDLVPPDAFRSGARPATIDQFLKILDDPNAYPVLIHCKAGLHRTGQLCAIYRMEYEGWEKRRAMEELRANGYGTFAATTGNPNIVQYVASYVPGQRHPVTLPTAGRPLLLTEGRP